MFSTLKEIISIHIHLFFNIIRVGWVDVEKETEGAFFGWLWLFAKPVIYISMFSFAMGIGLRQGSATDADTPYIIWIAAGLIPWFFMQKIFSKGTRVFTSSKKLIKLGTYPLLSMPAITAVSELFIFTTSFALLILLALLLGVSPTIYWLQLPILFVIMYIFYYFLSLLSSCLSTVSKDYQKLVGTISMAFFWTSGILFDTSHINNAFFNAYLIINPFAFVTGGFRSVLTEHGWFFIDLPHLLGFVFVLLCTALLSSVFFNRLKTVIRDTL